MTGAPRADGWWQASNGRWYPPELHPARLAAPSTPTPAPSTAPALPVAAAAAPTMAGGAVAVATPPVAAAPVPPGRVERRVAASTHRRRRALAVVVVGLAVVLVIAVVALMSGGGTAPAPAAAPGTHATVELGRLVAFSPPQPAGLSSATVLGIEPGVDAGGHTAPPPGQQFVSASIQICAGSQGSDNPPVGSFELELAGGRLVAPTPTLVTGSSNLFQSDVLAAGQCRTGFVSYQAPAGVEVLGIRFAPDPTTVAVWRSPAAFS